MSIGWPKANERLVVCARGCGGRIRALFALLCVSQRANSWATDRGDLLWIALLFVRLQAETLGTGLWERIEPVSCQEEKGT